MGISKRLKNASISNDKLVSLRKKQMLLSEKEKKTTKWECTELQKEFWHHWKIFPNAISNNIAGYIKAENFNKADALEGAFKHLLQKHDVLRSKFVYENDKILVNIENDPKLDFEIIDMCGMDEKTIKDKMIQMSQIPFDLEKGKLIRFRAIKSDNDVWYLLMIQHHIVSDGISSGVIINDMLHYINAEFSSEFNDSNSSEKSFYEVYNNNTVDNSRYELELKYWNEKMNNSDLTLHLPSSQLVVPSDSMAGARVEFDIDEALRNKIEKMAVDFGTTPFSVYMSALRILLYKYSKQEDAAIVIPIQGRDFPGSDSMVGCFLSMLPIRNSVNNETEIKKCIQDESNLVLEAMDYKDISFGTILKGMNARNEKMNSSVYHIVFSYENDAMKAISNEKFSFYELFLGVTKSDLTLELNQSGNKLHGWFEYRTSLYSEIQINLFIDSFLHLLEHMSECNKVGELSVLSEKDREMVLRFGKGKQIERPSESIPERFMRMVYQYQDKIALTDKTKELSFKELALQSYYLANKLKENGVGVESIVAIMMERTANFVIAVFAVLMAGGAYLPIEPTYPESRVKFMLEDSGAKTIILDDNYKIDYPINEVKVVNFEVKNEGNIDLIDCPEVKPDNLAYVIYTSGTTGNPKGVMLEHKGLNNLSDFFKEEYGMNSNDRVLQFAHVIFDAFSWEIAISILNGGSLHIADQNVILDTKAMAAFLRDNNITALSFPPQYWKRICTEDINLRMLLTAGSEADEEVLKYADKADIYINGYGPTENTVCVSTWARRKGEKIPHRIPIGIPMTNANVYIMDEGKLCGVNMVGEICVSGIDVSRGYLNNIELNSKKFSIDPYTNERMYRTGDYGYWLDDGNLAFVGRIDNQVKVRGYRIETEEVEKCIVSMKEIKSCAVKTVKDETNGNVLVAYIVSDDKITATQVNDWLGDRLPFYMIPSIYYQIDVLPVTINGKIDYKKLDGQGVLMSSEKSYAPPENENEIILCEIWKNVLGREIIGIDDPFFEIGGDSLLIIKIIEQAREKNLELEIASFYEDKTIRRIAGKAKCHEEQEEIEEVSDVNESDLETIMNQFQF